ncbi:hypothetical protein Ssi03_62060 [Sphaerisporangium siamense]|uniref:DUF4240 domain-containing protein n=1 Tax=Sphaerisporangium siamense TaxID=795645 RepID=A0A7W7GAM2_9ACTN|nr:hypothetical protein [Sphaerisporangium siamense]MBB4702517.1 hypothetical protein [Sphaerisporangium siamense]GII88216.1 hypothetical protein Ssi03_62060 [Sphaerisporangium siamense]
MTTTRTQEEILTRIQAVSDEDLLGFRLQVLLGALDFEHAKPFLKPDTTAEDWKAAPSSAEILEEAQGYYEFALGKIRDHRGISATRSVEKLGECAWLLGRDDVVEAMAEADYPQYGAPKVKAFADGFGLAWPDSEDMARMAVGEPCTPDCREGCGA